MEFTNVVLLAGQRPNNLKFDNYRPFYMFLGNDLVHIEEERGLNFLQKEWEDIMHEHAEQPCECGEDHSPKGLLVHALALCLFKCRYAIDIYGVAIEEVLQDPSSPDYTSCLTHVHAFEEKVGKRPSLEDTRYFELFIHEVCIQYQLDYYHIFKKATDYYQHALQLRYNLHTKG